MKFLRREKRFFAYMDYNGNEKVAYCCNPGKMADILIPQSDCIVTEKLSGIKYEWQAVNIDNNWIGVNTANPNKLIKMILPDLFSTEKFLTEKAFGQYRADFASENIIIEVKNVHWKVNNVAYFPDCVTSRGARQILDLIELSRQYQCYIIYVVQRNDVNIIKVADFIDKKYAENVKLAEQHGIKTLAFNCLINENGISIDKEIIFEK